MGKVREVPELRDRKLVFKDREDGGRVLAEELKEYEDTGAWVLAIPAGGVPVGLEVSKRLDINFDLILVRKVHVPWNPEAGFGSVTSDGRVLLNQTLVRSLNLSDKQIERAVEEEKEILEERSKLFRGDRPLPDLEGGVVILVDDGIASGFSMLAAVRSTEKGDPARIVVAVPTGSRGGVERIEPHVDEILCPNIRSGPVFAVADAYEDWHDLRDEEVSSMLPF